ncbi:MAG TPA: hypothetical protein VIX19_18690 [Terriglobales bacterium]
MIPLFAVVRISTGKDSQPSKTRQGPLPQRLGLWIPLFLIWLLLLPIVLVLSPIAMLGCLVVQINPFRAFRVFWHILAGLTGTHIEVKAPDAMVLVRIF